MLHIGGYYKRVGMFCNIKDYSRSPDRRRRGQEDAKNAKEKEKKRNLTTERHGKSLKLKAKGI